ncbi:MAG: S41 family peptidase, partial [Spirochaetaceae bacterium]|nr:S41 family peptidase [Spirochaetaceae bacterium]
MWNTTQRTKRNKLAWGATTTAMIVITALLSVSTTSVFGQTVDKTEAETKRYLERLEKTYRFIMQSYVDAPDQKKLYEGAMKGLFESLEDPYSVFLDESMMSRMHDVTSGEFGGVGSYISKQLANPKKPDDQLLYIEVVSPIEDTPSWKLGVKSGDLIIKIDGEDTSPMTVDEAQAKIRGEAGSTVVLTLRRGAAADFDVAIVRAKIELPTVNKAMIPTATGDVAYLRIIEFTDKTKARVDEALKEFAKTGYRALILDVRNNPGGLFDSVQAIADMFLDTGTI